MRFRYLDISVCRSQQSSTKMCLVLSLLRNAFHPISSFLKTAIAMYFVRCGLRKRPLKCGTFPTMQSGTRIKLRWLQTNCTCLSSLPNLQCNFTVSYHFLHLIRRITCFHCYSYIKIQLTYNIFVNCNWVDGRWQ